MPRRLDCATAFASARHSFAALNPREHWKLRARRWRLIGSPLRPPPEDVGVCRRVVFAWQAASRVVAPRALVLEPTPERVGMDWPPATQVLAVNLSLPMIRGLWPGPRPSHAAACADWLRLPLADHSAHLLLGNDRFNALLSGSQYRSMVTSLRRVIDDEGLLVVRFFVRPERAEDPQTVFADLFAGRIRSFHVFKWRLAMALHVGLSAGVRLADIWQTWHEAVPEPLALMAKLGWPFDLLHTIDGYRDVDTCYTFPSLSEVRATFAHEFREQSLHTPRYEPGACCPTLVLRPC